MFERFQLHRLSIAALTVASLDALTTYYFLAQQLGIEQNPILAQLVGKSIWWIPVYIVLPKLLLAVMPQSCKRSFAIFFITVCGTFAVNNTIRICGGPWLLDTIDLRWILLLSLVVAATFYFTENIPGLYDHQSLANALGIAVGWVCVFVLIEAGFLALGCILDGNVG